MTSTPSTPKSSEPRLHFVCRICSQEDYIENDESYQAAQAKLREMGVNFPVPSVCRRCDHEMNTPRNKNIGGEIRKYPAPCLDEMLSRYRKPVKRPPLTVPPEFMDTDPNHPGIDNRAFAKVQSLKDSGNNLLLRGKSGAGKSRAAWALLAALWCDGVDVRGYDASKLVDTMEEKRKSGWGPYFMRELLRVPVLFIDDIGNDGRGHLGQSVTFDLIKGRAEKNRRTICATQHTSETLYKNAFNSQQLAALIRRLRDHFQDVPFVKPKEEK